MTDEQLAQANELRTQIYELNTRIIESDWQGTIYIGWMDEQPRKDFIEFYNNQVKIQLDRAISKFNDL